MESWESVTNNKIIKTVGKFVIQTDLFLKNKAMNKMLIDFLITQKCHNGTEF